MIFNKVAYLDTVMGPSTKKHQIWQRFNATLCGFFLGQMYHVLGWLPAGEWWSLVMCLIWLASETLEARFDKREIKLR